MMSYLKSDFKNKEHNNHTTDAATSLMYLMIFVAFFREILVLFGLTSISTLFYYCMIFIIALICGLVFVRLFITKISARNIVQFFSGILFCVFLLFANVLDSDFSFSKNGTQMIGIMLLTLFLCCEWIIPITEKLLNCFLWLNFATSICLTLGLFLGSNYRNSELIYRYASTNQAGIIVMLVAIQLLLQFYVYLNRKKYSICTIISVLFCVMLFACYLTHSRSCLLTVILFLAVFLLFGSNKKGLKLSAIALLVMALSFPLLWVSFYKIKGENNALEFFGKPLFSGRESLWISIIQGAFTEPFKLHINELVTGSVNDHSAHNAFWELIWIYSVWFAIAYFVFIVSKVTDAYKNVKGKISSMFFVALIVLFFHMCFETTMISGAVNFTIKAFLVIPIMRGVQNDVEFKSFNSRSGLQRSKYLR